MKKVLGKIIWDISEFSGIGLGKYAPIVFGWMIGCKEYRKKVNNNGE